MEEANSSVIDKNIARLLMVSFFLPMQVQVLALFAGLVYFVFRSFSGGHRPSLTSLLPGVALGSLYLLYLGAPFFTPGAYRFIARTFCEYKVSYLLLPVSFALISPRYISLIIGGLLYFVYAAVGISIIANVWFLIYYSVHGWHEVNHVTYRIFFEEITSQHPTYISMYLVFGIGVLFLQGRSIGRRLKYALFYLSLLLLLPLLAKSPLLALGIILCHMAWLRRQRLADYKWLFFGAVALMMLSYFFIPFVSQRVNEMAGLGTSLRQNVTDNSIHERKMILAVDLGMLKHYWLTGCGPGRLRHLLDVRYLFYSVYYGRNVNSFDPHNEYFFQWFSFGLAGILVFSATLLTQFFIAIKRRQYLYIYLLLTLCITFFTESVLATQHGLLLYSFFSSLLFFYKDLPTYER